MSALSPVKIEAARELLTRRRARASILNYVNAIDVPGKPSSEDPDEEFFLPVETTVAHHHRLILEAFDRTANTRHGRLMVFLPPGSAKALALDTPIPTPDGWKCMGKISVGDRVFDETGVPCNVTWVSQVWRDRPVYRVVTDCGDSIIADREHEWLVRLCGKPRKPLKKNGLGRPGLLNRDDPASQFKIKETWELCRTRSKRPMISRSGPLELPDAILPVDPYLLGVWLGDGSKQSVRITSSIQDQAWLRSEIERLGYETRNTTVPTLFQVIGVRGAFAEMGLLDDKYHNAHGRKHIPPVYLRASKTQRLALLQGLVDTDGTVCKNRGCTTFCNINRELAESVQELVRSLGVKAGWSEGRAVLNCVDHGPVYRVSFYLQGSARMPRKAELTRNQERTPNTYIDVFPAGYADTVCIEVDSPSHLFLCGRSMTPTHNSTYGSVVFPSRYLGQEPGRKVILASYGDELAKKMGRRTRQICRSDRFNGIWGCMLSPESRASDQWILTNGSEYMACGILSGITGNRAHGIIIDDPVKGREAANSETIRQKTWDAYQDDLLTRLIPGGWLAIIQCMTGDTPVLMANGIEKPLRDIKPGDDIATYDNGNLAISKVINHRSNGLDYVYAIKTTSCKIIRANKRHPFLVNDNGDLKWVRLKDLKVGDMLVSLKDVENLQDQYRKEENAPVARQKKLFIGKILKRLIKNWGIGGSIKESFAMLMDAMSPHIAKKCVSLIIKNQDGHRGLIGEPRKKTEMLISSIDMVPRLRNIMKYLKGKAAFVQYANNHQQKRILEPIGMGSFALIIAMMKAMLGRFYAMTAISQLDIQKTKKPQLPLQNISGFMLDKIESIEPDGIQEVFDIQVERTENFIANGFVSHNTRWHQDDLAGRILPEDWKGQSGMIECRDGNTWEVLCIQAKCEHGNNDPLGRAPGEYLWPEWFDDKHWAQFEAQPQTWASLFQQIPSPADGNLFKPDNIQTIDEIPAGQKIQWIRAWDLASTTDGDWTAGPKLGRLADGRLLIADMVRIRVGPDDRDMAMLNTARRDGSNTIIGIPQDPGQAGKTQIAYLTKMLSGFRVRCSPESGDKITRAEPFAAQVNVGNVLMLRGSWNNALIDELRVFPNGTFDDQVDGLSRAYMELIGKSIMAISPNVLQRAGR